MSIIGKWTFVFVRFIVCGDNFVVMGKKVVPVDCFILCACVIREFMGIFMGW